MASTHFVKNIVMILVLLCLQRVISEETSSATNVKTSKEQSTSDESKEERDAITSVETGNNGNDSTKDDEKISERDVEIFRKLFLQKRAQHISAIDSLLETYEYQKTYQMIDLLLTRMRSVVGTAKATLVEKGFEPGMLFPTDVDTKEALSVIMENAGLFGDMALKLPDITHACLAQKKSKVSEILKWAITFSQDVGFLDDLNSRMFHLASQELDIIPKEPDFVNPFKQSYEPPPSSGDKKKKPKAEKKRGPRATKVEL